MKKSSTFLILTTALLFSFNAAAVPILNSFPGAVATIFLDFDGHYVQGSVWNGGNPINCAASATLLNTSVIWELFSPDVPQTKGPL